MPSPLVSERLTIVDSNNLLVRAIKAMERVPLSSDGIPTAGLLVFVNTLSRYVRESSPDRLMVCWDGGRSSYRLKVFDEYKGTREVHSDRDAPESPFALAKEFLSLAGIHHAEVAGVEGDDLVAAYWRLWKPRPVVVVSGDKDFFQLLDDNTIQVRPGAASDVWTRQRVVTERKCEPQHLRYVMALTGDKTDGVPGAPGIGPVTAVKLLSQYEWNLEALLTSDEAKVAGYQDVVRRSLALVDLVESLAGIEVVEPPLFLPTDHDSVLFSSLIEFLERYKLASVKERLVSGTLWRSEWVSSEDTSATVVER